MGGGRADKNREQGMKKREEETCQENKRKKKKKIGRHPQMSDTEAGNPKESNTHVTVGKAEQDGGKKKTQKHRNY